MLSDPSITDVMQCTSLPLDVGHVLPSSLPSTQLSPPLTRVTIFHSCGTSQVPFKSLPINVQLTFQLPPFNILTPARTSNPLALRTSVHILGVSTPPSPHTVVLLYSKFHFSDPSCLQSVNNESKLSSTKFQKETILKFWVVNHSEQHEEISRHFTPSLLSHKLFFHPEYPACIHYPFNGHSVAMYAVRVSAMIL